MPIETGPKNLGKKADAELEAELAQIEAEFEVQGGQENFESKADKPGFDVHISGKSGESFKFNVGATYEDEQGNKFKIVGYENGENGMTLKLKGPREEEFFEVNPEEMNKILEEGGFHEVGGKLDKESSRKNEQANGDATDEEKEKRKVIEPEIVGEDEKIDETLITVNNDKGNFEVEAGQLVKAENTVEGINMDQESLQSYEELVEAQKKYLRAKDEVSHLDKVLGVLSKGKKERSHNQQEKLEQAKQEFEDKKVGFRKKFGAFGQSLVNKKKLELEGSGMPADDVKGELLKFMQTEKMFATEEKDKEGKGILRSISEEYNHRLSDLDKIHIESLPSKAKAAFSNAWNMYRKVPPKARFAASLALVLGAGAASGGLTVIGAGIITGKKLARWKLGAITGAAGAGISERAMAGFQKIKDVKQKKTRKDLEEDAGREFSIAVNRGLDQEMDAAVEKGLLVGVEKKKKILDEMNERQRKQLRNRMIAAGLGGAISGYGASAFAGEFVDSTLLGEKVGADENIGSKTKDTKGVSNELEAQKQQESTSNTVVQSSTKGETLQDEISNVENKAGNVANVGATPEGVAAGLMNGETSQSDIDATAEKIEAVTEKPEIRSFVLEKGDSVWKVLKAEGMSDTEIMNKVGAFSKNIGKQLMEEKGMTKDQAMDFINGRFSHMDIGESFSLDKNGEIMCESFLSDNKLEQFKEGKWKIEQFEPAEKPTNDPVVVSSSETDGGLSSAVEEREAELETDPTEKLKNEIVLRTGFNPEREVFQRTFENIPESLKGNPDLSSAYVMIFAGNQEEIGQGLKNLFGLDTEPKWYTDDKGYLVVEDAYGKKGFNLLINKDSIGVDGPAKWNWGMEKGKLFSEKPTAELDVENIGGAREYIEVSSEQLKTGNATSAGEGSEQEILPKTEQATVAEADDASQSPKAEAITAEDESRASGSSEEQDFEKNLAQGFERLKVDSAVLEKVNERSTLEVFKNMKQNLDTTEGKDTIDDKSFQLMVKMLNSHGGKMVREDFGDYVDKYVQNRQSPLSKEEMDALANIYKKF